MTAMTREEDLRLREAAMSWLALRTNDGLDSIRSVDLTTFTFGGVRMPLLDPQRGIRKPAALEGALSIRTVYRPEGAERPYEDALRSDGLVNYKWRGSDPDQAENRALRAAMREHLPLIWFFGVGPGIYHPVFPVYLVWEEVSEQQFVVDPVGYGLVRADSPIEEQLKRYLIRETRQRVHQPVFRSTVLRAYGTRCAVCALGHSELLDAAHIVPDSHELGVASVRNGLSLCKIHHAAFDARILGIRPDLHVEIRQDLLDEVDGPMLQHGLKERHGQRLMVLPSAHRERPDPLLLDRQYMVFRTAS